MKSKSLLIFLLVMGVSFFCETVSFAGTLELHSDQTVLFPGDSLTIDIVAKDAEQFSGVLFTLEFPETSFELADNPVTTDFFDSRSPFDQKVADSFWAARAATDGQLYLAGFPCVFSLVGFNPCGYIELMASYA